MSKCPCVTCTAHRNDARAIGDGMKCGCPVCKEHSGLPVQEPKR